MEPTNLEHQTVLEIIVFKRRTAEIFLVMRAPIWLHLQAPSQSCPTIVAKLTLVGVTKAVNQHIMQSQIE